MSWWSWQRTKKDPPVSTITWSGRTVVDTDLLIRDPKVRALLNRVDAHIEGMRQNGESDVPTIIVPSVK